MTSHTKCGRKRFSGSEDMRCTNIPSAEDLHPHHDLDPSSADATASLESADQVW